MQVGATSMLGNGVGSGEEWGGVGRNGAWRGVEG